MTQFFDLGVTPGEGGTLNHSLSTVVIGKDGKVAAFYPTNEWTPQEVLAAMKTAAAA
jgi:protein SCO1/2